MEDLPSRLLLARSDSAQLNNLISDYTPFIKKEIGRYNELGIEYDDRLSLAYLIFMNCVRQYSPEKGSFLAFASASIRNRFIDEYRRNKKTKIVPISDDEHLALENLSSVREYNKEQERQSLAMEITLLSSELKLHGIDYPQLTRISPKQVRSRKLCMELAQEILRDESFLRSLKKHKRIPKAELAARFSISEKTIEKHRKYILTLTIILSGDYPGIRAFLPEYREGGEK